MKKVGIVIQARLGSTRFPGKVLKVLDGATLLEQLILKMRRAAKADVVIVATTSLEEDNPIAELSALIGAPCVRGSTDDLLSRYMLAAEEFDLDVVVRVTSDCPLLDPKIVDYLIGEFLSTGADFLANSEPLPTNWPDGMDVSIFSRSALEVAHSQALLPSEREHVSFFFWKYDAFKTEKIDLGKDLSKYRLTIDYPEDMVFLERLAQSVFFELGRSLFDLDMLEIVGALESKPELVAINSQYVRGLGWQKAFDADLRATGKNEDLNGSDLTVPKSPLGQGESNDFR